MISENKEKKRKCQNVNTAVDTVLKTRKWTNIKKREIKGDGESKRERKRKRGRGDGEKRRDRQSPRK